MGIWAISGPVSVTVHMYHRSSSTAHAAGGVTRASNTGSSTTVLAIHCHCAGAARARPAPHTATRRSLAHAELDISLLNTFFAHF